MDLATAKEIIRKIAIAGTGIGFHCGGAIYLL
jgi:hypothetical protein